jgi:protein-L-isoaspartate(D-aspartate) O-methyltransferase
MAPIVSKQDFLERRRYMVEGQLRTGGVTDFNLLGAFLDVPREAFVAPAQSAFAYVDGDLPSLGSKVRRLLPPLTLARLLQAASVAAGERALDVAGGAGYSAALFGRLGARVVALESDAEAAESANRLLDGYGEIEVVVGALAEGVPAKSPYDVVLVSGAFEVLPETLIGQLAEGGRLVGVQTCPLAQEAVLIEKIPTGFSRRVLFETRAATLDAFRRAPSFAF